jgi:hypothetical protein
MKKQTLLLSALLLFGSRYAHASEGAFEVACYSDSPDCTDMIDDLVTEKFVHHYPIKDYKIVIIAATHRYGAGEKGAVSFATVGVSPKLPGISFQKTKPTSVVPLHRFIMTTRTDNTVSAVEAHDLERKVIRGAISEMMGQCTVDPSCNLMK